MSTVTAMPKLSDLPQWIRETRVGAELLAEQTKKLTAERAARIAAIQKVEADREKVLPGLHQKVEAARLAVRECQRAVHEAQAECRRAESDLDRQSARFDQLRAQQERDLRDTAAPEIDEFISEMQAAWDAARLSPVQKRERIVAGRVIGETNTPAIAARMQAIRVTIEKARALKIEVADAAKIPAKLAELRAALPSIQFED